MAELTGAKISRGRLRGTAEKKLQLLKETFARTEILDTGQVSLEQTTGLQATLEKAKEALDKYTEAIDRCQALKGGEHDPEDEHVIAQGELEDKNRQSGFQGTGSQGQS